MSADQINVLKTYLNQIENDIITITNVEDKHEFKFLNYECGLILEIFLNGDYKDIHYGNNKVLIDIGANVGDTPIYFANKGYTVYAFEPLPHIANIAKKNLELNHHVKDKITYINKAVSCKTGKLTVHYDESNTGGAGSYNNSETKIEVETLTLEDIIKEFNIKPDILKMDCEGCEVGIIKNSDLSYFSQVIFEYHTGMTGTNENILIDILKDKDSN